MGIDIHMHILDPTGKIVEKDIFTGRDSEWFNNISRKGYDPCYEDFPSFVGVPENSCDEIQEAYNTKDTYYDFFYVDALKFKSWMRLRKPHTDAGWVTTYSAWLYEKKDIVPELWYTLDPECNINDMKFIEVINEYDKSLWLFNFLLDNHYFKEGYSIVYYFDC